MAYLYSNRSMTTEAFWKKFFPDKSYDRAIQVLREYEARGYFKRIQKYKSIKSLFILTKKSLGLLLRRGLVLLRRPKLLRINWRELEHDNRVVNLRAAFEGKQELENVFWVSDFEMRLGITPKAKAAFLQGKLNIREWRESPLPGRWRTPDGYFEADVEGKRRSFVLEYEHSMYSQPRISSLASRLDRDFPAAWRLVVCETETNAKRMLRSLVERVEDPRVWFVGAYDRVISAPFFSPWLNASRASKAA